MSVYHRSLLGACVVTVVQDPARFAEVIFTFREELDGGDDLDVLLSIYEEAFSHVVPITLHKVSQEQASTWVVQVADHIKVLAGTYVGKQRRLATWASNTLIWTLNQLSLNQMRVKKRG